MENKAARFDLTLLMEENEQGLKGSLEYNSYLFERVSMEQMMASFQIMLEALVADPDQHIWDLPLLAVSPVEQQEESAFPASASPMPHIQELFARQAMRTPTAPALVYKGEQLTYQELNQRANRVARQLLLLGVQPHMHVGLALERSLDLVVGLLGILKVAGVYVPLEVPSACGDVLKDAHIQYVVTRQELATHFQTHAITCLCLETLEGVAAPTQETIAENAIDADSILAILYQESTPSTALPACIYQNNEQIGTFLNYARQQRWESAAGSVWSPLSSALFLYELLLPLTTGGAAHLVPEQMCLQGLAYSAWLAEHKISSAYVPMSLLPDLLAWTRQGQPSHLRLLLTQAPAFPEQQLLALQQALPHTRIINGYGTPEVAPWATLYEVRASTGPRRCTPVGSPIDDTQLFLLDQYMHPVPR
ncbi:MAG TPA: AMP-binding protein, partial [Ktedonobacteraceae bacterium]|nr:AMP-binding protein [Ktedonobacteraceae bacterium]